MAIRMDVMHVWSYAGLFGKYSDMGEQMRELLTDEKLAQLIPENSADVVNSMDGARPAAVELNSFLNTIPQKRGLDEPKMKGRCVAEVHADDASQDQYI